MTFSSTPEPFLKTMEKYQKKKDQNDPYVDGSYGTVKKKKMKRKSSGSERKPK